MSSFLFSIATNTLYNSTNYSDPFEIKLPKTSIQVLKHIQNTSLTKTYNGINTHHSFNPHHVHVYISNSQSDTLPHNLNCLQKHLKVKFPANVYRKYRRCWQRKSSTMQKISNKNKAWKLFDLISANFNLGYTCYRYIEKLWTLVVLFNPNDNEKQNYDVYKNSFKSA